MIITAELSLYPLRDGAVPVIKDFIRDLEGCEGIEIVTNQLSTQLRGEFEAVTRAVNRCMRRAMETSGDASGTLVLVAKYLNVDKAIGQAPDLD